MGRKMLTSLYPFIFYSYIQRNMKRFLSMLALAVLVLHSVATSAVYATDIADPSEETVPETAVETEVDDGVSDESNDEVITEIDLESDESFTEDSQENADESDATESSTEETVEDDQPVSYGKSFSSEQSEKSWREISTNGLMVTAVDSLGAFPEWTEMVVTAIEEDEVFDLVNDAIEANVTKVRAVDITFWHNGEVVEPTQPINVTMRTLSMTEPQTVVHIDDDENVEEMEADIKGKTADFLAESFSIYAIVETDDPRLLVNFYDGNGDIITWVYVKASDNMDDLIFDPGIGDNDEWKIFSWWTLNSGYNTGTEAWNIQDVRDYVSSNFVTWTMDFYAMMFDRYVVKYFDRDWVVVIDTDEILLRCTETPCNYEYYVDHWYNTTDPDENLLGWKINGEGESVLYTWIIIDWDVELWADVKPWHWLIFDENGKGATYNAPRFVETNDVTSSEWLLEMVRNGYTFDDWYEAAEVDWSGNAVRDWSGNVILKTTPFVFWKNLTGNTTIYAKWNAWKTAGYTILVWKQNVAWWTWYDFVTWLSLSGNVGSTINTVSERGSGNWKYARINGNDYIYTGCSLKNFDQNVIITPEWNAVVNVYYDRNEYTLQFQICRSYGWSECNTIKEIKALYQQNISSNFPIVWTNWITYDNGERWNPQTNNVWLNQVIVYLDIMPAWNVVFHLNESDASTKTMNYYIEALPNYTGSTVTYSGVKYMLRDSINANYNWVTVEDYIDIIWFDKAGANPSSTYNNGKFECYGNNKKCADTVNFYYTRQKFSLNFMDGTYVDGNGNPIKEANRWQLTTESNIPFGADITSYSWYTEWVAIPNWYVFEGWYLDSECTQPAPFTTMPEWWLTVYAKWRQIQYRVFLHPNADNDPSLDWGSQTQAMNFRVSYGGKISTPTWIRTGYIFGGWYQDTWFNVRFNADAYVLNDANVKTPYDKENDFTDPMDKWWNGATWNSDLDRFRITKKLDLYAKWSKEIPWASGINLVYELSWWTLNVNDNKLYWDNSDASVLPAPTKEWYQFDHWVIQKWNWSEFVDTEITRYPWERFKVLLDNAKEEPANDPEHSEITKKYTIQIRAEYVLAWEAETTIVKYCPGEMWWDCEESEVIVVNNEYTIEEGDKFSREWHTFLNWKVGDVYYSWWETVWVDNVNSGTLNVLTAQWEVNKYTITSSVDGENGEINPKGETKVKYGDNQGYTFAPADGYTIKTLKVDNVEQTTEGTSREWYIKNGYEFANIEADHTIVVKYALDENGNDIPDDEESFKITPSVEHGTINPESEVSKAYGSDQEVTYEKETGYALKSVTVDGSEVDREAYKTGYTFSYITWDHTIVVKYALDENGNDIPDDEEEYTILFVNYDWIVLQSGNLVYGETPEYTWETPTKQWETWYVYTFLWWNPEIVKVTWDATYTATYEESCDTGYHYEWAEWATAQVCVENDKTDLDCSWKIPDNATAIQWHGKVHQTWIDNGWTPTSMERDNGANECGFTCDSGYVYYLSWDGRLSEKLCMKIEIEVSTSWACPEIPEGENTRYEEETEIVTWNAEEWRYNDPLCRKVCAPQYHEEEKSCVPDIIEVETSKVCGELAKDSHAYYLTWTQTLTYTVDENGEWSWSDPICTAVCEDNYHEVKAESTAWNDNEPVDVTIADGVKTNNADGTAANETSENTESETSKVNNFRCEIDTFTVTFNSNGWSAVTWQSVEYGKTATKPADPTKSSNTFQGWTLSGQAFDFSTPITWDITLVAQWKSNWWWGGGWWGWSSSSYRCENLPENAVANNTDKPNRNTDYSYSDDTSKVCTFQCKSGYTRDKDNKKCVKSENPWWGNWWEEEIELGWQVSDKCSVEWFNWSEEEKAAYLYACENDITTIRDINEARLKDFLTRAEMAKMVSVFATKQLWMKPNTSKDCSNFANSIASYNQEMKDYMVMSCQLELMWIHTVNYEPIPDFMPSKRVSRAEFGTVLSRVLWWNKYEGTNSNYYINHLNALKENNIITNINPNITEYRAWVFLMLYRAVEAIKVLKSTNNVAIDQQVNEELQEEWKAETWLVVEYDSGSVVPDMATLTESGTLATWAVAETWSTVEAQTGDTETTTWDIAKETAEIETWAIAETETWSTSH